MNKRFWFTAILCMIAGVTACNDDYAGSSQADLDKASLGDACDNTIICEDGLYCENSTCVAHVNKGDSCDNTHICITGLICKDTCVEENGGGGGGGEDDKNKGKAGSACTGDDNCESPLVCDGDICRSKSNLGGACVTDKSCRQGTCVNEICSEYSVETGDECDPGAGKLCVQDENELVCSKIASMCYPVAKAGERCFTDVQDCEDGYMCAENGVCMKLGGMGDDCDLEASLGCADPMECINGKCRTKVRYNCTDYEVCESPTAICYDGQCIESHECDTDSGCNADSYCCTEEACLVKHVCLPYGEGPRETVNEACVYETVPGLFEADIQCDWKKPAKDDPYAGHDNVLMTPLVMNTPHDSGTSNEIIFTTYNCNDGGTNSGEGTSLSCYGVIRIMNGETCELHESIYDPYNHVIAGSNLAMADVDNDGDVEIFASRGSAQRALADGKANPKSGVVAFKWDREQKKYVTWWTMKSDSGNMQWGGPAIHDIDNDGIPEIIGRNGDVFNSHTGEKICAGGLAGFNKVPTLGDIDGDGKIEIIDKSSIYRWNSETKHWDVAYSNIKTQDYHHAFADFGTPIKDGEGNVTGYNFEAKDGIAEVVSCSGGIVEVVSLTGYQILKVSGNMGGGPCTIGDFDGDTLPEVATAFGDQYRIFDPQCVKDAAGNLPKGCIRDYVLWETPSQDRSSSSTGSSLFDFDGDGAMEAVYADECFTRVYDGKTGDVLFSSYRSSDTWHEYPVIADVDNDESAELIVGSNNSEPCPKNVTPLPEVYFDPIHRGLRCASNDDCKSKNCVGGLCRCTTGSETDQCNSRTDQFGVLMDEYGCTNPLAGDETGGNVCRAKRRNGQRMTGVRVMRDRLDRWTSSRNIWNQHAYSITNINDDQTIPKTENWIQNYKSTAPVLNNYRQNVQGARGRNVAPDITGKLDKKKLCVISGASDHTITLHGMICNRGTKMVASKMPASFYRINEDGSLGKKYCTSYTSANVPVGGCLEVSCSPEDDELGNVTIRMIANDDGEGGRTTVECNSDNNTDEVTIEGCAEN